MRRFAWILGILLGTACHETEPPPRLPKPPHRVEPATAQAAPQAPWPVRIVEGGESVSVYPPKIESREADRVKARCAVEVERTDDGKSYGFLFVDARLTPGQGQDAIEDVKYLRTDFPADRSQNDEWLEFFHDRAPLDGTHIADAVVTSEAAPKPALAVKNDPPRIVTSEKPQVLVVIDGAPTLQPLGAVQRVINTRTLVLLDDRSYWALAGDRWFKASALDASFDPVATESVPAAIVAARAKAPASSYDPMSEMTTKLASGATLLVTTKPTELLETRGAPTWTQIPDSTLSYVDNTDADIFRDDSLKQGFVLLGGRWFSAPSNAGPWTYVEPSKLPASFQHIGEDSPKARVRASIPGTPEAEEAVIASEIATTAAVDRAHATLAVAFDGDPDFQPVEGTPLAYAINTETPVFRADDGHFYALENGVWFTANAATGPWVVATTVPESIYAIPASSPVHYVTYTRIYGWDPDYVWVGYTPGYYGAYVSGGVVVWGTGWYYRPWVGRVWYGRPLTWGWGVGFGYGVGYGIRLGGVYRPWWGPARYGEYGHWGGPRGYVVAHANAYGHFGGAAHPTTLHPQHAPPARAVAQPHVNPANHAVAQPHTQARPAARPTAKPARGIPARRSTTGRRR